MKKKVAITGAKGLLGSLLIKLLNKKKIPYLTYNYNINDKRKLDKWLKKNSEIEYFFHFAAITTPSTVKKDIKLANLTNIYSLKNIIKILKNNDIWFFFPSSSHVYEASKKKLTEKSKTKPISYYGKTKLIGENLFKKYKSKKLKFCIGRIFSVYHNNQKKPFLLPSIKDLVKKSTKRTIKIENGNSVRDFIHAERVIKIIFKLSQLKAKGTYNIANGKGKSVIKFLEENIKINKKFIPTGEKNYIVGDIKKLKKKLNEKV